MHISILIGVQQTHNSGQKIGNILFRIVLLKLNFQYDGQLDINCLIYILIFYGELLCFQLFTRGMRTHISIPTVVQNERISR